MVDVDFANKTIYACQTFVVTIPTWLGVLIAIAVFFSAALKAVEVFYRRKLAVLTARKSPVTGNGDG